MQLIDILPTIADVIGAERPPGLKGATLSRTVPGSRRIYGETFYPRIHLGWSELRSLVDERYHFLDGPRPELYDLTDDLAERNDLFSSGSEIARARKRELNGYAPNFSVPGQVPGGAPQKAGRPRLPLGQLTIGRRQIPFSTRWIRSRFSKRSGRPSDWRRPGTGNGPCPPCGGFL